MTGVGAATVIGGAVLGTIFPQISASADQLNIHSAPTELNNLVGWFINALIILVGTVTTLIFFQFGVRHHEEGEPEKQPVILEYISTVGQGFLVITLGVLFAGVYLATLSALIDRIQFLWETILRFI
jgi:heme/copper-type cytochrome/quinol oxidase subunit 2